MRRDDYIALLLSKNACDPAIHFAEKFPAETTAQEITQAYLDSSRDEAWALWAVQNIYQEAPELRPLFISKITNYKNRRLLIEMNLIPGLTEEDRRKIWPTS